MPEPEKPKIIYCPECFAELPADDFRTQIEHMARHPEVMVWELDKFGYHQAADRVLRELKKKKLG